MFTDDLNALNARFIDQWKNGVRVVFANQAPVALDPSETWVRFTAEATISQRETLGLNAPVTQLGWVAVQIFVPKGTDDGNAANLAAYAAAIFNNWRSADAKLFCDTAAFMTGEDDQYFSYTVRTNWRSYR